MKLLSRCPHCHQTESIGTGTDTHSAHRCASCGQSYVPHRHLFVVDELTDVTVAVRDDPVKPLPPRKITPPRPARVARPPLSRRQRLALSALALLLLMTLVLQVALHQRDLWSARWPFIGSVLHAVCKPLGCRIQAPEMLSDISVLASGFDQQENGEFVFSIQLQHRQTHAVATPALELTLTDAQLRAVVRKILLPEQLGLGLALPPGDGISVESRFTLDPELHGHVQGFRVELFYP